MRGRPKNKTVFVESFSSAGVPRAGGLSHVALLPRKPSPESRRSMDELLALRIHRLIQMHPTFGYRRIWAMPKFHEGVQVNRKAVYRILRLRT